MKKVCVVTGTRAEYGLLYWVIEGIRRSKELELQLIVTGMHLSPEFGLTVDVIEKDGFEIDRKVEMLLSSDTAVGVTKSMGLGIIAFADVLEDLKPDWLLVLGDRYEIFAAASSAMIARIPIVHLHGGEATEGAFDEAIRHSITKMSHIHFVAAEEYRLRVIQLGEQPEHVFNVGGLGVDNILRLPLLSRAQLEAELNFKFAKRNMLVTFHPVTLEDGTSAQQMGELLAALRELKDTGLIFTMPNSDTEGRVLFRMIETFCAQHPRAHAYTSLGQLRYLSCIQYVDCVIGNSSSGLAEVPSFKKGTINIGDRQRGRLKAESVIDCSPDRTSIRHAIETLYSVEFQKLLTKVKNPYGNGGASDAIVRTLENHLQNITFKKVFYNLFEK
jgi:GDP/UDP-N,N'-diacetylbacillosamine 2-epimerase (hydrolysing)